MNTAHASPSLNLTPEQQAELLHNIHRLAHLTRLRMVAILLLYCGFTLGACGLVIKITSSFVLADSSPWREPMNGLSIASSVLGILLIAFALLKARSFNSQLEHVEQVQKSPDAFAITDASVVVRDATTTHR